MNNQPEPKRQTTPHERPVAVGAARRVIIAGGTGYLGRLIGVLLMKEGYEVLALGRGENADLQWRENWQSSLEGAEAIINLSGETIAQKWTHMAQTNIIESRVSPTRKIGEALANANHPPRIWINASAIGIYGNRGDEILDEDSPTGNSEEFLVKTCLEWEAAQDAFDLPRTAKAKVRVGVVLGHGGALPTLIKLAKAFLGGHAGSGQQYMSWIHEDDLARLFLHVLERGEPGVFNGTAPNPVTNEAMMRELRAMVGRPWSPPVPQFALRVAGALGAPDPELLLHGQRVLPKRAEAEGFAFTHHAVTTALKTLIRG
ncbi:MAG: TIGR01777 family oxidoreductase [Chthonomonas sp.]|nr:TIGR01777 family oxidoreductase [Chthonomonas sp.]